MSVNPYILNGRMCDYLSLHDEGPCRSWSMIVCEQRLVLKATRLLPARAYTYCTILYESTGRCCRRVSLAKILSRRVRGVVHVQVEQAELAATTLD